MTDKYKCKLNSCVNILDYVLNNKEQELLDEHPLYRVVDIDRLIINVYNLNIPQWLKCCISVCCGRYEQYASFIFTELINSISNRKFDEGPIPKDYIITANDWIDCYEDGYPICIDGDENGYLQYIKDSYNHFLISTIYAIRDSK